VPLDEPTRRALREFFQQASADLVNHGPPPRTSGKIGDPDLAARWKRQRALDDTVTALRAGEPERAVALAQELSLGPSAEAALLALMLGFRHSALLDHVHRRLADNPALVHARYYSRTLLHAAAAAGSLATVELLLRQGADPNAGGHPPLYSLANECMVPGAGKIVRLLVESGAQVDSCEGVKRCTPLHMAARRGAVEIAEALLDCGADIEARDSLGETPLRRAVNCAKTEVAALLVARGASVRSRGSKGMTPLEAARSEAMRRVLRGERP